MNGNDAQPRLGGSQPSFDAHFTGPGGCEARSYERGGYAIKGYLCGPNTLLVLFADDAAQGILCRYDGELPSMDEMQTAAGRFSEDGQPTEAIERLQNGWALIPDGKYHADASLYLRDVENSRDAGER